MNHPSYYLRLLFFYFSINSSLSHPDEIKNLINPNFSPNLKQALEGSQVANALGAGVGAASNSLSQHHSSSSKSLSHSNPLSPINSETCVIKHIQESCHLCSQTEFQLNVDACALTHHVEKINCYDNDKKETVIVQSCKALTRKDGEEGIFSFCLLNLIFAVGAFYVSRKRQRYIDEKRNRRLQTQLQAL